MTEFWQNPEFARHRRAELRPTRVLTIALVVVVICVLVGLYCWVSREQYMAAMRRASIEFNRPSVAELAALEVRNHLEVWRLFYSFLIWMQAGILTFWSLFACAQAISGERERKTWDFQRTTRLTALDMVRGKLFGEPVVAYFICLCCLPFAFVAALRAGMGIGNLLLAYALILMSALFLGLTGLWISSLLESRSRSVGLIATVGLYALVASTVSLDTSAFPGLAAFSPITGLRGLLGDHEHSPSAVIFGTPVSWLAASLLLYLAFGLWFAVMLVRNIKKDYDEVRPLSRWQGVACAAFLNFVLCAFFYPEAHPWQSTTSYDFATIMAVMNAVILFVLGLAILIPHERLKVWVREQSGQWFAENGPPWPWLALSAVAAYAILVSGLFAWKGKLGFTFDSIESAAVQFLVVLVFVTRDVLFVQWCKLTRLRSPLVKGVLYLCLYYVGAAIVVSIANLHSESAGQSTVSLLTPAGVFDTRPFGIHFPSAVFVGLLLQLPVIGIILAGITRRIKQRPIALPVTG